MVKTHTPPATGETVCPACGAGIKAANSTRRRRVQCPKCRQIVVLESSHPAAPPPPPEAPRPDAEADRRIASLEARVELLEAALRDAMTANRASASGTIQRKLLWITSAPGDTPPFSPEQDRALSYNLGSVRSQAITIRTPSDDPAVRLHAEWFKVIFERAGWTVRGPEEIPPHEAGSGLSLAVPDLPVAKDIAATYLALKAAGFETTPTLNRQPKAASDEEPSSISLTLAPVRAA